MNNVSGGNKEEIYGYSGLNRSVPFLRTGYEYFVPSNVTNEISDILSPLNQYYCVYKNALNRKRKMTSARKPRGMSVKPKAETRRTVIADLEQATEQYQSIVNGYVLVPQAMNIIPPLQIQQQNELILPPQQIPHQQIPQQIPHQLQQIPQLERIPKTVAQKRSERIKRIIAAKALRNRGGGKRKTRKRRKKKTRRKRRNRKKRTRKR